MLWTKLFILANVIFLVEGDFNLVILHTNDVHARVEQTNKYSADCSDKDAAKENCYGGVGRRYSAIADIRRNYSNVVVMDAGDQFQGSFWFSYYNGSEASYFMNKMGYDVMALGNHEFDNGVDELVSPFLENVTFPVVACNLDTSKSPRLQALVQPYAILNVSGTQVGVVGYVTDKILANPETIKDIKFSDPLECVRTSVNELKAKGITVIVALGHTGFQTSKLVAAIPGVDVVVDGHSHTFLYNGNPPSVETPQGPYPVEVRQEGGGTALVYTAYAYGKYLGMADIIFNDAGELRNWTGNPLLLDKTYIQDADILKDVRRWKEPIQAFTQKVVGQTYVKLEGGKNPCRLRECNLGNLVTDAILYTHLRKPTSENWTDVAMAMWNGGGIRVPIEQGDINLAKIILVLPYRNYMEKIKVTGLVLRQVLEHSVTELNPEDPPGRFLQYSGIKVTYNLKRTEGSRVVDVMVKCADCDVPKYTPLDDVTIYSVLINNYLINGGDGYTVIRDNILERENIGTLVSDALADYIKKQSPIIHGLEGRISFREQEDVETDPPGACSSATSQGLHGLLMAVLMVTTWACNLYHID